MLKYLLCFDINLFQLFLAKIDIVQNSKFAHDLIATYFEKHNDLLHSSSLDQFIKMISDWNLKKLSIGSVTISILLSKFLLKSLMTGCFITK